MSTNKAYNCVLSSTEVGTPMRSIPEKYVFSKHIFTIYILYLHLNNILCI